MLIGELARETGLSRHAIRFYEREGLLVPGERLDNGYRSFGPDDVQRLRFVVRLKELGFTLEDIRELLRLRDEGRMACANTGATIKQRMDALDEEIARMQTLRAELDAFFQPCAAPGADGACTPLATLHMK